jgi:adenylylsulfate reductase subunit B
MIDRVNEKKCNGCGLCAEICPMDVLRMKTKFDAVSESAKKGISRRFVASIAYRADCMTCYTCELKCPKGAIEVGYTPLDTPPVL